MREKKFILITVLSSLILLPGCTKQISKGELQSILNGTKKCSVLWVWYTGSDEKYHYFKTEILLESKAYRIRKSDLVISKEFAHTNKKQSWLQVYSESQAKYSNNCSKVLILDL